MRVKKFGPLLFALVFLLVSAQSGRCAATIAVKIKSLVESEDCYVITDKGDFELPGIGNKIDMGIEDFRALFNALYAARGHGAVLHLDDGVVVGADATSRSVKVEPKYAYRSKKKFAGEPVRVKTVLSKWYQDTYALRLFTSDGQFCLYNEYAYTDYVVALKKKLEAISKPEKNFTQPVTLDVHPLNLPECGGDWANCMKDGADCKGETEDLASGE